MSTQTEAERLADQLDADAANGDMGRKPDKKCHKRKAAAELRRLHEANQAMLEALKNIVEGGLSTSRIAAAKAAIAKATGEQA